MTPTSCHPLRVQVAPEHTVDVVVRCTAIATIGQLADALAAAVGAPTGLTVTTRWPVDRRGTPPSRDEAVRTAGPVAGSTVVLVPDPGPGTAPPRAPVRLVGGGGGERTLRYTDTDLGPAVITVDRAVTVRSAGAARVQLNGSPLRGSATLQHGDLLRSDEQRWTVHLDGPLRPPAAGGWTAPHRPRADHRPAWEPGTIELPAPPAASRLPGFPVLSATVPAAMGVALWLATGSWWSAGFMLFSVVFVVASALESRREARAEQRHRLDEHREQVAEVVQRLHRRRAEQRRHHADQGWTPAQLLDLGTSGAGGPERTDPRVWCRGVGGAPTWTVRLGTATLPLQDRVVVPEQGRADLRRELRSTAEQLRRLRDVVVVDLDHHGGLVIEGAADRVRSVARSVVAQLAVSIPPELLGVQVVTAPQQHEPWSAVAWLPHRHPAAGARRVLVVDTLDGPPASPWLPSGDDDIVIWLTGPDGDRPPELHTTLVLRDGGAELHQGTGLPTIPHVAPEPMSHDECEPLFRRLAGLHLTSTGALHGAARPLRPDDPSLPERVALGRVLAHPRLHLDPDLVERQWRRSSPGTGLVVPVGVDARGGVVNVDLVGDGPHTLIAGTTGSGKSELLRTLLVSTALHHDPDRVQLLLVDYKGGAAFGALTELPHVVGTITDLSGTMSARALESLGAELRRRERVLADRRGDHWSGTSLVIVVDELATLVAEQPAFVDGLVDLAQRGRSLGMHLVLATQRPAGVVSDAVRANISVRIALRTAHGDDSRDVLDDPVAALLPRAHPGRAVMRVGSAAPVVLQSAHCGTELSTTPPVTVGPLHPTAWHHPERARGADPAVAVSPLDAAVRVAATAAGRRGQGRTHRPWLDPLPQHLALEDLAAEGTSSREVQDGSVADRSAIGRGPDHVEPAHRAERPGVLVVGLIDRPELQRRDPLELDLAHSGGALIVGAGGSGRSTALHTTAVAAWRHPDPWELYVIDAAPAHSMLAGVGSVGDVIDVADSERVLRLLRSTAQLVTDRVRAGRTDPRPGGPARRVLVVDGIAAFDQRYDRLDRGAAVELLTSILRDGRAVGVHVVVTAHRRAEVPAEMLGLLGCRWVLRCASDDDASTWGLGPAAADRRLPPGRCHVEGALAQVAVADASASAPRSTTAGAAPPPVPRLPTELWRSDLQVTDPTVSLRPAVGLHGDTLEPVHLVLDHHHAIVAGPPRSGVSTALATIAAGHPHPVVVRPGDTAALEGRLTDALAAARQGHEQLVVVHDLVHLLEARDGEAVAAALEAVAREGRDAPVRLVVGGELDGLTRSYHDLVAILRRGRTGLLLGADPDQHATLWHTSAPPRSDLPPAPGRGWLIQAASVHPVQVAQP